MNFWMNNRANILVAFLYTLSLICLIVGVVIVAIDIEAYGWGLYLILWALVTLFVLAAASLVGSDERKENENIRRGLQRALHLHTATTQFFTSQGARSDVEQTLVV